MSKKERSNTEVIEQDFTNGGDQQALSLRETESGWGMQPQNMSEAMKLCKFIAESNVVPKDYRNKPSDIFVAIQHGQEIGIKPLQSLNSISVINGRPTVDNITFLALARMHPEFEWIREDNQGFAYARDHIAGWEHLKDKDPDSTSICVVKRKGEAEIVGEFTNEDVKRAGLGNVHKTYPKDMRKYRARQRALEPAFGDVLKGFKMTEIEQENVRAYGEDYEGAEEQQQKSAAVADSIKASIASKSKQQKSAAKSSKQEEPDEDTLDPEKEISEQDEEPEEETEQADEEQETEEDAVDVPKPDADKIDREKVQEFITKASKKMHEDEAGMAWYKAIKEEILDINPDVDNMLDLSNEELIELADRFDVEQ